MRPISTSSLLARGAFGLAIIACLPNESGADVIDFSSLGFQTVPSLDVGGVTILGSSTLSIGSNGLGILGGVLAPPYGDAMIDPTESVTVRFDSAPVTDIVLTAQGIGSFGNAPYQPRANP